MYEVFEQLLQKYGISAYKVAKEAGVTQTALSNWKKWKEYSICAYASKNC